MGAVFIDLRKAFDTVNHQMLLNKLPDFSLSVGTHYWTKLYLSSRDQCAGVNINGLLIMNCAKVHFFIMTEMVLGLSQEGWGSSPCRFCS